MRFAREFQHRTKTNTRTSDNTRTANMRSTSILRKLPAFNRRWCFQKQWIRLNVAVTGDVAYLLSGVLQVQQRFTAPLQEETQLVFLGRLVLLPLRAGGLVQHLVEDPASRRAVLYCLVGEAKSQ